MATEKQIYQFEIEAKKDKLRSSQRHRQGWRPLATNHKNNQWEIIWTNDPAPPGPKQPKDYTDLQLANKINDDDVTFEFFKEWVKRNALAETAGRWQHFKGIFRP